jgi:hypothetical protein
MQGSLICIITCLFTLSIFAFRWFGGGRLGSRRRCVLHNLFLLVFLLLTFACEGRTVTLGVAHVGANFQMVYRFANCDFLGVEFKHEQLNVLPWNRFRDKTNGKLLISPHLACQVIKDRASVAIFFLNASADQLYHQFSREELVLLFVDGWLRFALLGFFGLLLGFQFRPGRCERLLLIFLDLSDFIS